MGQCNKVGNMLNGFEVSLILEDDADLHFEWSISELERLIV
uniref:Uncharacterized protein n=1 Tax=Rhizophora mucronata TaxID=61149 RepID=A0A2P2PSK0_RHIMU